MLASVDDGLAYRSANELGVFGIHLSLGLVMDIKDPLVVLAWDQAGGLYTGIRNDQRLLHNHRTSGLEQGIQGLVVAALPDPLGQLALVHSGTNEQLATVQTFDETVGFELGLEGVNEVLQRRNSSQELGFETGAFVGPFAYNGTNLGVASAIQKTIVCVQCRSLSDTRGVAPLLTVTRKTRLYLQPSELSPTNGAVRFGPLGPTPLRDSRCTFSGKSDS